MAALESMSTLVRHAVSSEGSIWACMRISQVSVASVTCKSGIVLSTLLMRALCVLNIAGSLLISPGMQ